jgi:hypothetical protein
MAARQPIACLYQGHPRAICPTVLGHSNGAEMALVWQFAGSGSQGVVSGQWKCLALAEVANAEMMEGPWRTGEQHRSAQTCVKNVDLDMNPDSPYAPKRKLPPTRPQLRIVK